MNSSLKSFSRFCCDQRYSIHSIHTCSQSQNEEIFSFGHCHIWRIGQSG